MISIYLKLFTSSKIFQCTFGNSWLCTISWRGTYAFQKHWDSKINILHIQYSLYDTLEKEGQSQPFRGVFLGKGLLRICSKCTGEHPFQSAISLKLLCNLSEIALWQRRSPVNLLHISRSPFPTNTSGGLLLEGKYTRYSYFPNEKLLHALRGTLIPSQVFNLRARMGEGLHINIQSG